VQGLVQCDVQNRKILRITVGGRGGTFRGIKFCGGPLQLHFVELSFWWPLVVTFRGIKFCCGPLQLYFVEFSTVVAPSNYIFTKKGEVLIITSCSLCKYDRRESPCKTSRYIIKSDYKLLLWY
jgi:hypothetical protein